MTTLTCPLCGSPVKVPNSTPHVRLSCRKCHTPFHLNRKGAAVVGDPPDVERDVEALKQKVRESVKQFPVGKVVGGLALVVVVWTAAGYLLRGPDPLKPAAEAAAKAFAEGDAGSLKSIAADGTADDLARWYERTHPNLLLQRGRWHGKPEVIEIGIGVEDHARRKGSTAFTVHPAAGNARDVSIGNPEQSTEGALGSFDSEMEWVLGRGGHWELDGRAMHQKVLPPPAPVIAPPLAPATPAAKKR